jgi:Aldehyde dehydrogenase family
MPVLWTHSVILFNALIVHIIQDEHGGEVVVGGTYDLNDKYFAPTIVLNPKTTSKLMTEEIFGPILPILVIEGGPDEVYILYYTIVIVIVIVIMNTLFMHALCSRYTVDTGIAVAQYTHSAARRSTFCCKTCCHRTSV